jgi:hypothetical protein
MVGVLTSINASTAADIGLTRANALHGLVRQLSRPAVVAVVHA